MTQPNETKPVYLIDFCLICGSRDHEADVCPPRPLFGLREGLPCLIEIDGEYVEATITYVKRPAHSGAVVTAQFTDGDTITVPAKRVYAG